MPKLTINQLIDWHIKEGAAALLRAETAKRNRKGRPTYAQHIATADFHNDAMRLLRECAAQPALAETLTGLAAFNAVLREHFVTCNTSGASGGCVRPKGHDGEHRYSIADRNPQR